MDLMVFMLVHLGYQSFSLLLYTLLEFTSWFLNFRISIVIYFFEWSCQRCLFGVIDNGISVSFLISIFLSCVCFLDFLTDGEFLFSIWYHQWRLRILKPECLFLLNILFLEAFHSIIGLFLDDIYFLESYGELLCERD